MTGTLAAVSFFLAGCGEETAAGGGEAKIRLETFQAASLVIGRTDFIHGGALPPGAGSLSSANPGQPACAAGKLYVPDAGWNRILVYDTFPAENGRAADGVFGQADFVATAVNHGSGTATGLMTLNNPRAVVFSGDTFLVLDASNHRVLVYHGAPSTWDAPAYRVIGQEDATGADSACAANRLNLPSAIACAGGRVIVADSFNNRVLVWNAVPTTDGAPADIVLGQAGFTNNRPNDDRQDGTTVRSARTLHYPLGVWSDGTRLAVADCLNNRVLVWNTFPATNFTPADVVVGQPDMTNNRFVMNDPARLWPFSLTSYASQLFVSDSMQNRVMVWNDLPATNGAPADIVLGQPSPYSRDDNYNGISARALSFPQGLLAIPGKLVVNDAGNRRILVYESR